MGSVGAGGKTGKQEKDRNVLLESLSGCTELGNVIAKPWKCHSIEMKSTGVEPSSVALNTVITFLFMAYIIKIPSSVYLSW